MTPKRKKGISELPPPSSIPSANSPKTTYERRKHAPLHYLAQADNALFTARILRHMLTTDLPDFYEAAGYRGRDKTALRESYGREIGVALELIIKAAICQRIERDEYGNKGMPKSHDLIRLWQAAKLPTLDSVQKFQLYLLSVILTWAGRYPVPTSDTLREQDLELTELQDLAHPPKLLGDFPIRETPSLDHEVLLDLYIDVRHAFFELDRDRMRN